MPVIHFNELCAKLDAKHRELLGQASAGIEKEGLRVLQDASISQTAHPQGLGSALCHPHITTDYSEAMLELITAPHIKRDALLGELADIHRFVYRQIGDELIWPGSMPCVLDGELSVPIAQYGSSNSGQMKHIYRRGLWHRYGRTMQAITGIHYNFSLPETLWQALYDKGDQASSLQDFKSAAYLAIIRNFRRHAYIFSYLFGASPAVDESFFKDRTHALQRLDKHTLYLEHATCLRMTDIGYKSAAQKSIQVCYNTLDSYIQSLKQALNIKYPEYELIGTQQAGEYMQLNCNLLQIENEFYSEIRPKRTPKKGQTPLCALAESGIEYIELRIFDLDPFLPLGINQRGIDFIDAFLLHCLLSNSPACTPAENQAIKDNLYSSASSGLNPTLQIEVMGNKASLLSHGGELLEAMRASMQSVPNAKQYLDAIDYYQSFLEDRSKTPAARIIDNLKAQKISYRQLMLNQAKHHQLLLARPLSPQALQQFELHAQQSLAAQQALEQENGKSFAEYLAEYEKQSEQL